MSRTPKTAAYAFEDPDDLPDSPIRFGVVRCPEGDREAFARLAAEVLQQIGEVPGDYQIAEPVWRWFRMNPDPTREYRWLLGRPDGPGRGNWMGALVEEAPSS